MFTTLEHLEQHIAQKKRNSGWRSWVREIKNFTIVFLIVFIVSNVVVNAQLYQMALLDLRNGVPTLSNSGVTYQAISPSALVSGDSTLQQQRELHQLTQTLDMMTNVQTEDFVGQDMVISQLQENLNSYHLNFNTLPPSDRIIIPKINVNVPIVQSTFNKHVSQMEPDDFDKDLYRGVVQYPTTPNPGEYGNTLLLGHTSYESWKKNPYATVFAQMPKLRNGDVMQMVRNGKLYEYEVVGRSIVNPDQVNNEYLKYTDGDYVTLLGCYPIGSDKQRILIFAKIKES